MYYRGAAAAIVVYDITRSQSFRTLKNWVEELRSKGPKDIVITIAGNKADLDAQRVCHDDNNNNDCMLMFMILFDYDDDIILISRME